MMLTVELYDSRLQWNTDMTHCMWHNTAVILSVTMASHGAHMN